MRPTNEVARSKIDALFRRLSIASAAELSVGLGVSPATTLRIIKSKLDQIVQLGSTKQARYALRRQLRGESSTISVYLIDELGNGHEIGSIDSIEPEGTILKQHQSIFPTDAEYAKGHWPGLPYFLYDMKPQGYLGRNLARRISADLGVPADPDKWNDDDTLYALMKRGADTSGNIIVGDLAYQLWLQSKSQKEEQIRESNLGYDYARLASETTAFNGPGSSAGGEFPKFTAARNLQDRPTPHVIVKFSGNDESNPVKRWSDLLVCEHIALETINSKTSIKTANSRIIISSGRTMLETERFDRVGEFGRKSLVSLSSIDGAFLGTGESSWPDASAKLVKLNLLSSDNARDISFLWWFGQFIGNSDMHFGNLSFHINDGMFYLAPVYDMLPMMYAPLAGGEIPQREYNMKYPFPKDKEVWTEALKVAISFWDRCMNDNRISHSFKNLLQNHLLQLRNAKV